MLHCKIFDLENKELIDFPIKHFNERLVDSIITLSCVLSEDVINNENVLDQYLTITDNVSIGSIKILKDQEILKEYANYTKVDGVSIDYNLHEINGVVLFSRKAVK